MIMKFKMEGDEYVNIIACVDDNFGMLFAKRRQSRDRNILKDIENITTEIWISPFSKQLFKDTSCKVKTDSDFLTNAKSGEFCFVEADCLLSHADKIEQLILYKWNRKYPADFYFALPLSEWKCIETTDFSGHSHEIITREIYIRG